MSYLQALNAGLINPTNQVSTYTYNTIEYPITSNTSAGYQYFEYSSTGWYLDGTPDTWNELYFNDIEYPAGIYTLSAIFNYQTSGVASVVDGGKFYIGISDDQLDLEPTLANYTGSSLNEGVLNLNVIFISDGDTKNMINFVYNINFSNSVITDIGYSLTRIG